MAGVGVLLSLSLIYLWPLINTIQIVVHLPLMAISMPSNAYITTFALVEIATFDLLPHESINTWLFNFKDLEDAEFRFVETGYETNNFILNTGTVLWIVIIWILAALGTMILGGFQSKSERISKWYTSLATTLFFGFIIRVFLEGYFEIMLSAFINFNQVSML
jgi:hypothetical protein